MKLKTMFTLIALIALIALPTVTVQANNGHALFGIMADRAVKNLATPPKVEKKVEPFMINGLFIGQTYDDAQLILQDHVFTSVFQSYHPAFVQMLLIYLMHDYVFLYGYNTHEFVWTGFNFVLIDAKTRKVVVIFFSGHDASLNHSEIIPETPKGEKADLKKFAAKFKDLNDIQQKPKYGYLPNNPYQSAYFEMPDCFVFLFENFTIKVMGKTPKLKKSISPVPVNKNRSIPKKKLKLKRLL
jgi:hypothetical protein